MWQVVGQAKALSLLEHSLKRGNLAHAYLFVGLPHVGKSTLALNLAQALNCEDDVPPCGQCQSCRRIISGKHADVRTISLDTTGSLPEVKWRQEISIEDIRDIQHAASLPPYEGKHKVFIIDGAEHLSSEAANCLLKILEEPPSKVMLLLLTAEERHLLPTVVSRCQRLELKPMPVSECEQVLIESHEVNHDQARLLARLCRGCLGWALTALGGTLLEQRAQAIARLVFLLTADWEERFIYAAELATQFERERKFGGEIIGLWLGWWRDLMLTKAGCKGAVTNIDYELALEEWAREFSLAQIKDFIGDLQRALEQISMNANPRLVLEVLMLNMPRKEGKYRTGGNS